MLQFDYKLNAESRSKFGKMSAAKLRKDGFVPAVIYSKSKKGESISVSIPFAEANCLVDDYLSKTRTIELNIEGRNMLVVLRYADFNPLTDLPDHLDFAEVEEGEKIVSSVPIRTINADKSVGVKRGGDVFVLQYNVPITIPVSSKPVEVLVDLDSSITGQRFKLSDAILPDGASMVKDYLLVKIVGRKSSGTSGGSEESSAESSSEASK